MTALKTKLRIGPQDQGRRMSLKKFEFVRVEEGYHYELARGFITASEVPNYFHGSLVDAVRDFLSAFRRQHRGLIHRIFSGTECKLLIPDWESERHPDVAVYLKRPVGPKGRALWRVWIPEIVIEIVSPRSSDRDYVEKREEYWTLGVKEYWIVDAHRGQILQLRRGRNQWIEKPLKRGDTLQTKLLPGFKLSCAEVFDAVGEDDDSE
jgi:Uma2 family endonuclease